MREEATKYKAIWAWGRMMGSFTSYIRAEAAQAKADNAPESAIFKQDSGEWATLGDIKNPNTIHYFKVNHPELYARFMAANDEAAEQPPGEYVGN